MIAAQRNGAPAPRREGFPWFIPDIGPDTTLSSDQVFGRNATLRPCASGRRMGSVTGGSEKVGQADAVQEVGADTVGDLADLL
jgi:hypothetical protein